MSVQSTRVTRHNSKSRPAAPQARARQLGSPPVTKPTRNPRAKTSPSSKSSSSTNNAQSNGSANNLISNLQQQVSQTFLSLLAVSLLSPCCLLAVSLLSPCCLLVASLLPPCCLLAVSVLPPCCLLAASLPPPCRLLAASLPPPCFFKHLHFCCCADSFRCICFLFFLHHDHDPASSPFSKTPHKPPFRFTFLKWKRNTFVQILVTVLSHRKPPSTIKCER
jgi:hypothetical protein